MFGQVGQALLNVLRLRPGPASDQLLVVVGQVHKGGSVLPQADGVNEGEAQFAGREEASRRRRRDWMPAAPEDLPLFEAFKISDFPPGKAKSAGAEKMGIFIAFLHYLQVLQ